MKLDPRILGATLGAAAALSLGGVGLAWAQEAPSTTEAPTTEAPAPDAAAPDAPDATVPDREDCEDGRGPGAGSSDSPDSAVEGTSL